MTETQTQEKMPTSIILESERKRIDSQLREDLRAAQQCYKALKDEGNLGTIPQPHLCTEAWLQNIYEEGKKAVDEVKFLTIEQRNSQKGHWGKILHRMLPHVVRIQRFIASIPQNQYFYDEELGTFYYQDITALATERATFTVPTETEEHWQKIQAIMSAINELRQWESDQDVKKIPLDNLLRYDKARFVEAWVKGEMKRDHSFDDKPYMAIALQIKKAEEEKYL
jgi:spermidine synthase